MSRIFTRERCIPWLSSRIEVRLDDDPHEVAPDIDRLRARLPGRVAAALRRSGALGLFVAAIVLLASARPERDGAAASHASGWIAAGGALGGLSLGALVVSRRLGRHAPALAILCAGRRADLRATPLAALVGDVRDKNPAPPPARGLVWLISEQPLPHDGQARARELAVRSFTVVNDRIAEV